MRRIRQLEASTWFNKWINFNIPPAPSLGSSCQFDEWIQSISSQIRIRSSSESIHLILIQTKVFAHVQPPFVRQYLWTKQSSYLWRDPSWLFHISSLSSWIVSSAPHVPDFDTRRSSWKYKLKKCSILLFYGQLKLNFICIRRDFHQQ